MKLIDYIIIGVMLGLIALAIRMIIKNKKKGKCLGCSGDCEGCKYHNEGNINENRTK